MKKIETTIEGVYIIESDCFGDNRGWFMETYNQAKFHEMGIDTVFVQDNMSFSAQKGTLRGLHFQRAPYSQTKLVRCTKGRILDVAVDIRKGSKTFGKWVGRILSEENKQMLYMPEGFAHGFVVLSDEAEFLYKVSNEYSQEHDRGIRWNDPDIGVNWGIDFEPMLSEKDKKQPFLKDVTELL